MGGRARATAALQHPNRPPKLASATHAPSPSPHAPSPSFLRPSPSFLRSSPSFLRRQEPRLYPHPRAPPPQFTPPLFQGRVPNSSLPPPRGEVRWGVGGHARATAVFQHPNRPPELASATTRPPRHFCAPPRHSCAGRNPGSTHTPRTPSPIHPSPLPGGRLGGGWEAARVQQPLSNTPTTHPSSHLPPMRPPRHPTRPLRHSCAPLRHSCALSVIPAPLPVIPAQAGTAGTPPNRLEGGGMNWGRGG